MVDICLVTGIIFRDDDLTCREEPARHIDGGFEVPARVPAHVEDEFRVAAFDKGAQCIAKELRRIGRKAVERNHEHAAGFLFKIHDRHVDDIADHFHVARLFPAFAHHFQDDLAAFRATDAVDGRRDVHATRRDAVNFKDEIRRLDTRTLRRRAFEGCDDGERLVFDSYFHPNARKFAAQIFFELLLFDGREVKSIGVTKRCGKALDHAVHPFLLRRPLDNRIRG